MFLCGSQHVARAGVVGIRGGCRYRALMEMILSLFWCLDVACDHQAPAGATAKPQCVLEKPPSQQPSQCALICSPLGSKDQCPPKASCKKIQSTGLCTYDT